MCAHALKICAGSVGRGEVLISDTIFLPPKYICAEASPYFSGHRNTGKTTIIPSYDERMLHELSIRQLRMNTKALVEPGDTVL